MRERVPMHNPAHTLMPARLLDDACISGGNFRERRLLENSFSHVGKLRVAGDHHNSVSLTLWHLWSYILGCAIVCYASEGRGYGLRSLDLLPGSCIDCAAHIRRDSALKSLQAETHARRVNAPKLRLRRLDLLTWAL